MKPLSKLKKNVSCTGKVVVEKVNNEYIYKIKLKLVNKVGENSKKIIILFKIKNLLIA